MTAGGSERCSVQGGAMECSRDRKDVEKMYGRCEFQLSHSADLNAKGRGGIIQSDGVAETKSDFDHAGQTYLCVCLCLCL